MHGRTLELIEKIVWECLLSSLQSITSFWSERVCLYWLWRGCSALCWSAEVGELRPGATRGPFSVLIHPTEQFSRTNTLGQPLKPPKFHVLTAPKNCLPWPPRASVKTQSSLGSKSLPRPLCLTFITQRKGMHFFPYIRFAAQFLFSILTRHWQWHF